MKEIDTGLDVPMSLAAVIETDFRTLTSEVLLDTVPEVVKLNGTVTVNCPPKDWD